MLQEGPLAQSVEQRTFNPWVVGSIPTGPTIGIHSGDTIRTFVLMKRYLRPLSSI
jgi:hypothetical protein